MHAGLSECAVQPAGAFRREDGGAVALRNMRVVELGLAEERERVFAAKHDRAVGDQGARDDCGALSLIGRDGVKSLRRRVERYGTTAAEGIEQRVCRPFAARQLLRDQREDERAEPPLSAEVGRERAEESGLRERSNGCR